MTSMEPEPVTNMTNAEVEFLKESRERLFHDYIQAHPLPIPVSNPDVPMVRLTNVEEKVEALQKEADQFCADLVTEDLNSAGTPNTNTRYERLVETCVKLQIQLDSINVREELRLRKRQLLVKINSITGNLDKIFQANNINSS